MMYPPYMYDLHLHSSRSDGQLTPLQLVDAVQANGLRGFAITDHNYMSTELSEVAIRAQQVKIDFIPGVEISSKDFASGLCWHVLGYGADLDAGRINAELSEVRAGYNQRAKNIITKLQHKYPGLNWNYAELLKKSGSSFLHRNILALELKNFLDDGRTLKELLPEIFAPDTGNWLPSTREAVQLIVDCGGQAVLAHPIRPAELNYDLFENFLNDLLSVGLTGLEVFYAKHNEQQINYLRNLATTQALLMTGGSDWHGPDYSFGKQLGCLLPDSEYRKFFRAIKKPVKTTGKN